MSKISFVNRYRRKVAIFLAALADLEAERREYDALDYSTTLLDEHIPSGVDFAASDLKTAVSAVEQIANAVSNRATVLYRVRETKD